MEIQAGWIGTGRAIRCLTIQNRNFLKTILEILTKIRKKEIDDRDWQTGADSALQQTSANAAG